MVEQSQSNIPENPNSFWSKYGPEAGAIFLAVSAGAVDAVVYKGHQEGVVNFNRGLDIPNFMAGGAIFATHLRLLIQLAYIGEIRGVYQRLGKRYPEAFVKASNLTSTLPTF